MIGFVEKQQRIRNMNTRVYVDRESEKGRFARLSQEPKAAMPPGYSAELSSKPTRVLMRERAGRLAMN